MPPKKKELVLIYDESKPKDWYVSCTPEQAEAAHKKIDEVRARLKKEIEEEARFQGKAPEETAEDPDLTDESYAALEDLLKK